MRRLALAALFPLRHYAYRTMPVAGRPAAVTILAAEPAIRMEARMATRFADETLRVA
jgi:hypothetical protein